MTTEPLFRPQALEVAAGWVPGFGAAKPANAASLSAREAFEDAVRVGLHQPPCFVAFSGGRDSSALLAVASHVARREGLAQPVAVLVRYPGDADANESEWQDLVLRHLGADPVILDGREDKDALGPTAQAFLQRHGLLWPAFLHDKTPLLHLARGGSLLTGDGGDEVLGPQRITPVRVALGRRRLDRAAVRAASFALAPVVVRRRQLRQARWGARTWLTPAANRAFLSQVHDDEASAPLIWREGVRRQMRVRSTVMGLRNYRGLGAAADVAVLQPFLDPDFVEAFTATTPVLGPSGRNESMRRLFADLLPDRVLTRTSKATFNSSAFGPGARDFVARWTGGGVDPALVDAAFLREAWSSPTPPAGTFLLLQQAWLRTEGLTG